MGTTPTYTLREGSGAIAVNVAAYFRDPDGDPLTYTAVSSDGGVVTAVVSGSTVTLAPVVGGDGNDNRDGARPGRLEREANDCGDGDLVAGRDRPRGAGGVLRRHRRPELGDQYELEDGGGAGRVVRGEDRTRRPGHAIGSRGQPVDGADPAVPGEPEQPSRPLSLWVNQLSGPIPPELGNLRNLTALVLWGNQLTGPIPVELGNLTSLSQLDLSVNQLSGPIPPELGNLRNLGLLWLGHNQLTGPIPPGLGNLSNLWQIHLAANQLSGPIPVELGSLTDMSHLWLDDNRLSGTIPPELANLTYLVELRLDDNQLSGRVPPELGDLANLEGMHLNANTTLTGPLPQRPVAAVAARAVGHQ